MTLPTKIVVIGAGSASFGENTLSALVRSGRGNPQERPSLRGSHLALVDRNAGNLEIVRRLAERLNGEWDAGLTITAHAHHTQALEGAGFVVSAIEVGAREVCGGRISRSRSSTACDSRTPKMAARAALPTRRATSAR